MPFLKKKSCYAGVNFLNSTFLLIMCQFFVENAWDFHRCQGECICESLILLVYLQMHPRIPKRHLCNVRWNVQKVLTFDEQRCIYFNVLSIRVGILIGKSVYFQHSPDNILTLKNILEYPMGFIFKHSVETIIDPLTHSLLSKYF